MHEVEEWRILAEDFVQALVLERQISLSALNY